MIHLGGRRAIVLLNPDDEGFTKDDLVGCVETSTPMQWPALGLASRSTVPAQSANGTNLFPIENDASWGRILGALVGFVTVQEAHVAPPGYWAVKVCMTGLPAVPTPHIGVFLASPKGFIKVAPRFVE